MVVLFFRGIFLFLVFSRSLWIFSHANDVHIECCYFLHSFAKLQLYMCRCICCHSTPCFIESLSTQLAHPSRADDIERIERCVGICCLASNFVTGQMESSSFAFRFFLLILPTMYKTKQLSYSNYLQSQTDLSQCRAHFKFKWMNTDAYTVFMCINLLSRCKNLI